jgi:hypothetical protein
VLAIVDNLDVGRTGRSFSPLETHPPLVVDPDAVLPLPVSFQSFKPIARQGRQILQRYGRFQTVELEPRSVLDTGERFDPLAVGEVFSTFVAVTEDHELV